MKTKNIFIKHQKNLGFCKTGVHQSSLKKADAKSLRTWVDMSDFDSSHLQENMSKQFSHWNPCLAVYKNDLGYFNSINYY